MHLPSTRTRQLAPLRGRRFILQQLAQGGCADLVQGGSQDAFYRLQIGATTLPALGKNPAQQLVYFARHFLMDCSSRFFSWSVQPPRCCSTGRSAQILSFRSTKSSPSCWKR